MREVLEDLKNNQILYNKNVLDLKECIHNKYPGYTAKQTATLFATAIHKIVDKHITQFDKNIQGEIKNNLLQEIVQKEIFDINAHDIFEACAALNISDEQYLENLTDWVNDNQRMHLSKAEVFELALQLAGVKEISASMLPVENTVLITESPSYIISESIEAAAEDNLISAESKRYFSHILTLFKNRNIAVLLAAIITISLFALSKLFSYESTKYKNELTGHARNIPSRQEDILSADTLGLIKEAAYENALPQHLKYKEINMSALYTWLNERDSMLAEEPYLNSIINVAREYNINPLLMFAITGQEQSFVPRSNPKALSIINNPFNVYGSWETFNTDITDTSRIAARTIITLSKDRPKDEDPIKWINKKYAEDPNWHLGVSNLFHQLEEASGK